MVPDQVTVVKSINLFTFGEGGAGELPGVGIEWVT
jgi:hypothetical protein